MTPDTINEEQAMQPQQRIQAAAQPAQMEQEQVQAPAPQLLSTLSGQQTTPYTPIHRQGEPMWRIEREYKLIAALGKQHVEQAKAVRAEYEGRLNAIMQEDAEYENNPKYKEISSLLLQLDAVEEQALARQANARPAHIASPKNPPPKSAQKNTAGLNKTERRKLQQKRKEWAGQRQQLAQQHQSWAEAHAAHAKSMDQVLAERRRKIELDRLQHEEDIRHAQKKDRIAAAKQQELDRVNNHETPQMEREALGITMAHSVVEKGITEEIAKTAGVSSYHHTVRISEAEKLVEKSRGFLRFELMGNGMAELRATLPEKLTIPAGDNGTQEVRFRRTHNIVMKSILSSFLDKSGHFKEGINTVKDLEKILDPIIGIFEHTIEEKNFETIRDALAGGLENVVEDEAEREIVLTDFQKLVNLHGGELGYRYFFDMEGAGVLSKFYQILELQKGNAEYPLEERIAAIRDKMNEEKSTWEEIARLRDEVAALRKNHAPDKDISKKEDEYRIARNKVKYPETPEEQEKLIAGIRDLHNPERLRDVFNELKNILDMDNDSEDVVLINACSANGYFQRLTQKSACGDTFQTLRYNTTDYMETHLGEFVEYALNHINQMSFSKQQEIFPHREMLENIQAKLRQDPKTVTENDLMQLKKFWNNECTDIKYEYHQAPVLAEIKDEENDTTTYITSETFAPETKDVINAPFTLHQAIGRYVGASRPVTEENRGRKPEEIVFDNVGLNSYYVIDHPIPDEADLGNIRANQMYQNYGELPGVSELKAKRAREQAANQGGDN